MGSTSTTDTENPFKYCGEYVDEETGFVYLRNRYYDPSIGCFTTMDTHWNTDNMIYGDKKYDDNEKKIPDINAIMQSNNLYTYCRNNPLKYKDPFGRAAIVDDAVVIVVVAVVTVTVAAINVYYANKNDPYARPNQKKQGRERKEKKKQSNNWNSNPNKRVNPPKNTLLVEIIENISFEGGKDVCKTKAHKQKRITNKK